MPPPPKYSPEQKLRFLRKAREMQRAGMTKHVIADHLGIKPASLSAWMREQTLGQIYPPLSSTMPRNRSEKPNLPTSL